MEFQKVTPKLLGNSIIPRGSKQSVIQHRLLMDDTHPNTEIYGKLLKNCHQSSGSIKISQ